MFLNDRLQELFDLYVVLERIDTDKLTNFWKFVYTSILLRSDQFKNTFFWFLLGRRGFTTFFFIIIRSFRFRAVAFPFVLWWFNLLTFGWLAFLKRFFSTFFTVLIKIQQLSSIFDLVSFFQVLRSLLIKCCDYAWRNSTHSSLWVWVVLGFLRNLFLVRVRGHYVALDRWFIFKRFLRILRILFSIWVQLLNRFFVWIRPIHIMNRVLSFGLFLLWRFLIFIV